MADQSSINFLRESRTEWELADIQDLGEGVWGARATTTHLRKRGEPEQTFCVLGRGCSHFKFPLEALPALASWCQRQQDETKG